MPGKTPRKLTRLDSGGTLPMYGQLPLLYVACRSIVRFLFPYSVDHLSLECIYVSYGGLHWGIIDLTFLNGGESPSVFFSACPSPLMVTAS